jgi:hypothetical protein
MTNPLRKSENEEITTADIAQRNRSERPDPEIEEGRPKLVQSERGTTTQSVSNLGARSVARTESQTTPLFPETELQSLRTNWDSIQTAFVDEPRKAVEQADSLVASTMTRLADVFAQERSKLEEQWGRGDNVSTEDLRVALQRYRSFFHRLLAI